MNRFIRPSILLLASAVLAVIAALLVFWPGAAESRAVPVSLPEGDQEVVWLYSATSGAQWERFVAAVDLAVTLLRSDAAPLELDVDKDKAFPLQTTAVPEVSITQRGGKHRLRFRWYKLTSDLKSRDWVRALSGGKIPPQMGTIAANLPGYFPARYHVP